MPTPTTAAERVAMLSRPFVQCWLERCDVLDENDQLVGEIAGEVTALTVRHDADAEVHRTCTVTTFAELAWGRQRIKPWVYVAADVDGVTYSDVVPLGVFLVPAPRPDGMQSPRQHTITCYDKLMLLHQPLIQSVSLSTGSFVLGEVVDLMAAHGVATVGDDIDPARGSDVLTEPFVRPLGENHTALTVVNDLLQMVAYDPVTLTGHGVPRASAAVLPTEQPIAWTYDAQTPGTLVIADGRDAPNVFTDQYNVWLFIATGTDRDTPPTESDGLFRFRNEDDGPSSIAARGGIEVPRVEPLEALTQADLEANARVLIEEDKRSGRTYSWVTTPNPYHGHRDMLDVVDRDYAVAGQMQHRTWEFDVFAARVSHEASMIAEGVVV